MEKGEVSLKRREGGTKVQDQGPTPEPPVKRRRWDSDKKSGEQDEKKETDSGKANMLSGLETKGLSIGSLQKAKEALKMQKRIAEKMKALKQKGTLSSALAKQQQSAAAAPGSTASLLSNVKTTLAKSKLASSHMPKPLRLDSQGREVDEDGNVLNQARDTSLSQQKARVGQKEEEEDLPEGEAGASVVDEFLDPRMRAGPGIRRKKATFEFVKEGRFQKLAQKRRMRSKFAELGYKGTSQTGGPGSGSAVGGNANLVPLGEKVETEQGSAGQQQQQEAQKEVTVEWWDAVILENGEYGEGKECGSINNSKITLYVEHPIPIQPPKDDPSPAPQPLKLTKKEQKKLRTQQRQAREKEKQEMIRQGLLEPPKPKVKISNLVRVLGSDATQDPTKIEKEVRAQMNERLQAHEDRNLARKLTPAERREKKMRKMFDPDNGLFMALFKVRTLTNAQHKYKIDVNAEENMLTGCVLTADSFSLVVIEGCSKSVKRYKKLMLKRIQWDQWIAGEEAPESIEGNFCKLLWEGTIISTHFNRFRQEVQRTDDSARKYLGDFGLSHLWDLAIQDK